MFRRQQRAGFLRGAHRGAERHVGRIRFRRGGEIDHRLSDGELALGTAEKIVGVLRGVADHQRLWIGKADVLHRHAHDTAREEQRIFAGIQHAREIIQRRVRIGAAHRFVQGRDQVVVAVGGLVVDRGAALQDGLQLLGVEHLVRPRRTPDLFGQRQRRAAVAVRHPHQHRAGFRVERQLPALDLLGAREQPLHRRRIERAEHQHPRARQ